MNALIEKFLASRGLTKEDLTTINNPKYEKLNNIDILCARLHEIHDAHKRIVVLPDYDMDGIMSGVVGRAGLAALGFKYGLYIPRPQEGYGFGEHQIERLVNVFPDVEAIITCDTGISCVDGTQYASNEHDIEVLITDHHKEIEETSVRPYASVVVDPCSIDETYAHPQICGAYVFWQVLARYAKLYGTETEQNRIALLKAFAAVGTISDVMPLLYENRQLVRDGIKIWKAFWDCDPYYISLIKDAPDDFSNPFRGIYAICRDFAKEGKIKDSDSLNEEFFGFYLAPTFNSIKRMDGELSNAFDVFFGTTQAKEIQYLMDLNAQRKVEVDEAYNELITQDNPMAPYIYTSNAKPGLMGLLAMKMMSDTGYPSLVVSPHATHDIDLMYSGSGRAPSWYQFISRTEEAGIDGHKAGHEGAFGCRFLPSELDELYDFLCVDVPEVAEKYIQENGSLDTQSYDLVIAPDGSGDTIVDQELFLDFLREIETLRPFGSGFEKPVFKLVFDGMDAAYNAIGKDKNHLKISLVSGLDAICWNQANFVADGIPDKKIEIIGHLETNEFRGNVSAQFVGDIITEK